MRSTLRCWLTAIAYCVALIAQGQPSYFVDGFHGGIYGHYPTPWYTDFMLNQLEEHPEWCINLELEPETWDSVRQQTPEAYARFCQAMRGGERIEVVNPTYAQPYLFNISGESIIRHFQYGMRKLREHFPGLTFYTYSSEEPCFTSCLPQLLGQLGFRYVVLKNPDTCWGGYAATGGGQFVWWTGADGSTMPCVPRYDCEALQPGSTWQTTAWKNSDAYLRACRQAGIRHPVGMCLQDAGWKGGPWIGTGSQVGNDTRYTLWRDYFQQHLPEGEWPRRRFSQDDFRVSLMWGSAVLQRIARQVRDMENRLVEAEKMDALTGLENGFQANQEELDLMWHELMLCQHHDSWIVPYNKLRGEQTWAEMIAGQWGQTFYEALQQHTHSVLKASGAAHDMSESTRYIRIFNPSAQPRSEVIAISLPAGMQGKQLTLTDASGRQVTTTEEDGRLSFVAQLPAFGYATYRCRTGNRNSTAQKKERIAPPDETRSSRRRDTLFPEESLAVLENSLYRLEVDMGRGGTLRHLILKQQGGRDLVDSTSQYRFGELRGYFPAAGRFCSSAERGVQEVLRIQDGPVQQLALQGQIAGTPYTMHILLHEGSPLIRFRLNIQWPRDVRIGEPYEADWKQPRRAFYDTRYMLSALFPAAIPQPRLSKDAPFDVCESRQASTFYNRWDSIRHNIILHWVDLSADDRSTGLALLSDHTTSYSYAPGYPLALTVQYAGPGLWGRQYPTHGSTDLSLALYPHAGDWEQAGVPRQSESWNTPPPTCAFYRKAALRNRSFLQADDERLVLSAAWFSDGALHLRLYNSSRQAVSSRLRIGLPATELTEENLLGQAGATLPLTARGKECETTVSLPPFGIRTYRLCLD